MSIEEWPEGQLVVKGDIVKYASKLFEQREYFGAFARIHALIEFWMQDLYELDYLKKRGPIQLHERLTKLYRYGTLVRDLEKSEILTSGEATRLREFGWLRDRIMHRLVKYSYQTYPWHVVKKDEVLRGFEEGLALAELLSAKAGHQFSMTIFPVPMRKSPQPNSDKRQLP